MRSFMLDIVVQSTTKGLVGPNAAQQPTSIALLLDASTSPLFAEQHVDRKTVVHGLAAPMRACRVRIDVDAVLLVPRGEIRP